LASSNFEVVIRRRSLSTDVAFLIALMTESKAPPYFAVIVAESELATRDNFMDLTEGDVLIVTQWSRIGWWWGVSAFDSSRFGWFKSTLTQPYTGELPAEGQNIIDDLLKMLSGKEAKIAVFPKEVSTAPVETGPAPSYAQRVAISSQGATTEETAHRQAKFNSNIEEDFFDERQLQKRAKR
jgi:hypothetical protein